MARFRAVRAPFRFVPLAALLLLAACSVAPADTQPPESSVPMSPGASTGAPGASSDASAIEAATAVLEAVDLADGASIDALQGLRFTPAGTEAAARLISAGATVDALWAATYVYASSNTDPTPLLAIATSTTASSSIRAMAAAGLIGAGELAGFDPLIATLALADPMAGSEPAGFVWEFAAGVLERYTAAGLGPALAASDADRTASQGQWQGWLAANRDQLRFDAAANLWVVS